MTLHIFQTEDLGLAAKLHAAVLTHHGHPGAAPVGGLAAVASAISPPTPPVAEAPPPPPPPPTQAAAPPPPPPAAATAPPPPPPPPATAAAPPPPPPAAATAAPAGDAALMVPPQGWTEDHVKTAAAAFTQKFGAAALVERLAPFCPTGTAKPSIKKVYPAYWPNCYSALTAA